MEIINFLGGLSVLGTIVAAILFFTKKNSDFSPIFKKSFIGCLVASVFFIILNAIFRCDHEIVVTEIGNLKVEMCQKCDYEQSASIVSKISLSSKSYIKLENEENNTICFQITANSDYSAENFEIVINNNEIVSATFNRISSNKIYFDILALAPGKTTIFLQTTDASIKSESVNVEVIAPQIENVETKSTPHDDDIILDELFDNNPTEEIPAEESSAKEPAIEFIPESKDEVEQPQKDNEVKTYVLNNNSMKFHYSTCRGAKSISEHNKSMYTGTRDDIIAQGYSSCGICHP